MSEHTPTPWSYRRAKFPTDGEYDCGISAVIDGRPYCIGETVGRCATEIKLPAEANAAFIVKAVNNHVGLVNALEGIAEFCSADVSKLGAIERLASIRNTAINVLAHVGNSGSCGK